MNKDLLDDMFGRFRELSLSLARRGHEVIGICLSYLDQKETGIVDNACTGTEVHWSSVNAGSVKPYGFFRYIRYVNTTVQDFKPDIIWACSDSIYGILGTWVAKKHNTHCVFDLYDNFDSFGAASIPGIRSLYHRAIRNADGLTCVSRALRNLVSQQLQRSRPTLILENGIRKDLFFPRDKMECRNRLGLPLDAKIIGAAGALHDNRGISSVFEGFNNLARQQNNYHLALAGPRDKHLTMPPGPRVHDFGVLPLEQVPILLCALDVAVISNKDSEFGRYCFPQKAYEILACRVPLVAASVGAMKEFLVDHTRYLFEPENGTDFARAIRTQMHDQFVLDLSTPTWDDLADKFDAFLHEILAENTSILHSAK